jgi:probable O-glycosylation ligase (exosortase A-associated)
MSIRFLVLFAFLIPGLIAGLFNRFAAFVVYVWFAMFRPQEWVFTDITWLRLSLVSGLVLVIPSLLTGVLPNLTHPISLGSVLFLLTGLAAQTNAVRPDIGWDWLDYMGRLILVCLFGITILKTRWRLMVAITVFASALGIHAAKVGVMIILTGGMRLLEGFGGSFGDNNEYALGVVMVLPFLVAAAQNFDLIRGQLPRSLRWGWWASVPLCVLTIVATYSRGGAIALAAAALVFLILQRRKIFGVVVLGALAVLAVTFAGSLPGYVDRLSTARSDTQDSSAQGRLHFWRTALTVSADYPLGIGLRNFEQIYDQYDTSGGAYGRHRAVHNSHLQVLVELGIAGFLLWLFLFGYAVFAALRLRRAGRDPARSEEDRRFCFTVGNAFLTSIAGFLVGGTFLSMALNDATWFIFAFVAAADRLRRQEALTAATSDGQMKAAAMPSAFAAQSAFRP